MSLILATIAVPSRQRGQREATTLDLSWPGLGLGLAWRGSRLTVGLLLDDRDTHPGDGRGGLGLMETVEGWKLEASAVAILGFAPALGSTSDLERCWPRVVCDSFCKLSRGRSWGSRECFPAR